jgi:hypothetical protein
MDTTPVASPTASGQPGTGLPRFNYLAPVLATLLAAVFLFLVLALLAIAGVLNTVTQFTRVINNEQGGSPIWGGACGLITLALLAGAYYFLTAILKGVRDLAAKPLFTRGSVAPRAKVDSRKAANWLVLEPEYAGADLMTASAVTDEQRAASVDRSEIFQPRFSSPGSVRFDPRDAGLRDELKTAARTEGYLRPDRISAKEPEQALAEAEASEGPTGPRVVFRIDFASAAGFAPGDEMLVAHSRFLQHVYYVARLRSGQWELYRNRSLI